MMQLIRVRDWPLRAKMAALLVVASSLPLAVSALRDVRDARRARIASTGDLLGARADHVRELIDGFHRGYRVSIERFARLPLVVQYCRSDPGEALRMKGLIQEVFSAHIGADDAVRGGAVLDPSGAVRFTTDEQLLGDEPSRAADLARSLRGSSVISEPHVARSGAVEEPILSYYAPVPSKGGAPAAVVVLWVRVGALWQVLKASNGLAGAGSFAVLFDRQGIRIAHTYSDDMVFHPGGPLEPGAIEALVAEHRFGRRTRELLADVRPFPEQFERARSGAPDLALFRGVAPVNQKWNYGVARRLDTVPWTLFYMLPEATLDADIAAITRYRVLFVAAIMSLALLVGALFSAGILEPIRSLSAATSSLASGDLSVRIAARRSDELGRLAASFNAMAERIEAQTALVNSSRDELERRVVERTAQLESVNEALLESRTHYQSLAESLPHLVWTCLPDGSCDYLSGQWVEYTGRSAEEQLGHGWTERLHPDDVARTEAAWTEATRTGGTYDVEFRIQRADGVYRWFKTRAAPLCDASGQVVKWFGSNTDIDDYKQAAQRVAAQLERLALLDRITRATGERQDLGSIFQVVIRSIEDHLSVDFGCICLHEMGQDSVTVSCVGLKSEPLATELAMSQDARIRLDENGLARCVRGELVHEPDIAGAELDFPRRLARGGLRSLVIAPLSVESRVFGVLVAARRQAHSFTSGECEFLGQLSQHVALAAHQAQLYAALQDAYDDLRLSQQAVMQQERLRALGQMASGIAHDINNAISPIALYTETLLEREPDLSPRARGYLEVIQHAIEDVGQTVSRMREFYRQREPELVLARVDVNRLVQQVIDLSRARWSDMPQQNGIAIELATELAPDLPPVMAVESEIREALLNLVFNAVDAMPGGGTLNVRTRGSRPGAGEGRVHIEVSDSGVGMDQETRRHCTEPFFTTKGERGTGLGLATVHGVARRHQADLEIESARGEGTSVQLTLAAAPAAGAAESQVAEAPALPPRLRILVIDDDPLLLRSLRDSLEGDGHVVVSASDGQAGIDAFGAAQAGAEPFSVVITDLGMPYVDGRQVAAAIKRVSPSTPVILLTGWGHRLVAEGEVPEHVDEVLSKPPKLLHLREALARQARAAATGRGG